MLGKKIVFVFVIALSFMFWPVLPEASSSNLPSCKTALAMDMVLPRWNDTDIVQSSISNSGKTISVSLLIAPKKGTVKSSGSLYLEKYSGGKWTSVTSWSVDKTGNVDITKTYTGKSRVKYRAKAVVTVGVDEITALSSEIKLK